MKVKIDADLCTACGLCTDGVPQVFKMGKDVAEVIDARRAREPRDGGEGRCQRLPRGGDHRRVGNLLTRRRRTTPAPVGTRPFAGVCFLSASLGGQALLGPQRLAVEQLQVGLQARRLRLRSPPAPLSGTRAERSRASDSAATSYGVRVTCDAWARIASILRSKGPRGTDTIVLKSPLLKSAHGPS